MRRTKITKDDLERWQESEVTKRFQELVQQEIERTYNEILNPGYLLDPDIQQKSAVKHGKLLMCEIIQNFTLHDFNHEEADNEFHEKWESEGMGTDMLASSGQTDESA